MDHSKSAADGKGRVALRIVTRTALLLGAALLAACASPGIPPGGPVDTEAPKIQRIVPDSGKTGTTPKEVIFRFDEVVNERPSGVPSLTGLFLISPSDGEPRVDWHREEISVRPRRGWKKNTAYTITLLPGISDLRGNISDVPVVTLFSTGATIPSSRVTGTLFNWPEARTITRNGFVQAWPRGDTTLKYIAATDSLGVFRFPNLAPGDYVLRGIGDDNNNRGLDPREPWDTAAVTVRDSAAIDVYSFPHDSLGTRLQSVSLKDSVTMVLSFDNPLSITQPVVPANIRVRAPDSTDIGVLSVTLPPPDTTAAARRLARPIPTRTVSIKLARPVRPKTLYRIRVTDVRNLLGIARSNEQNLTTPAALPTAPAPVAPPAIAPPPAAPPPAPVKK